MDEIYADSEPRERMLGRIRTALSIPSGHSRHKSAAPSPTPQRSPGTLPLVDSAQAARQWLPPVADDWESRWALFVRLSERLKTEVYRVGNLDGAAERVARLEQESGWQHVAWHDHPLVRPLTTSVKSMDRDATEGIETRQLEECDAGITGCDALIAQTASVLVTNHSAGGRALSVLPPHHVVIAARSQMVATLADGFAQLRDWYRTGWPSFCSLITGPSRTADIERVLVLGAHGPRRLTVIVVDDGSGEAPR